MELELGIDRSAVGKEEEGTRTPVSPSSGAKRHPEI